MTILEQMDKRFDALQQAMDKRFDAVDRRFEAMQQAMDKRFEASDKRFEALARRLDRFMFWSFSLTVSVGALIVAAIKLWP
jgi:hypothetical protein